jgi:hypothetical protein
MIIRISFRLLSKADENVFQSVVNANKTTEQHPAQESSTLAITDVRLFVDECFKKN